MTDELQYPSCGSDRRNGEPCKRPAGWGTPHPGKGACKLHGGSMPNHIKRWEREAAKESVRTLGLPEDVDPAQALLDEVQRTAGHVRWLGNVVAGLESGELVWGKAEKIATPDGDTVKYKAGPNVWYQLYQAERKHLAQACAMAISAGVSERMVKVYERVGDTFVEMMEGVLSDLGLTEEQRARVPAAVVSRLQVLTEEGQ